MPQETGFQQATTVSPAGEAHTSAPQPSPPRDSDTPRLGQRIGPYELWEHIGRGGMGDVYRAFHSDTGEEVALKLLRGGEEISSARLRSMSREIEAARRLSHPGILAIRDIGVHDGKPYYTMPLVAGGSLADRLRDGRLDLRAGVEILAGVARAIQAAHLKGVIHRDLKPGNILISDGKPLVADFGLARFSDQAAAHTMTGDLMGSPYYMAPEQAGGHSHKATPATDVWPMGVMLYELLAGQRPFRGETLEVLRLIQVEEPVAPRHLREGVPADLEAVCLRCLRKNPRQRYRSMVDLADDLDRWLSGRRVESSVPAGTQTWVTRSQGGVVRYLLLLVVCLAFLALIAPASPPPPTPEEILLRHEARSGPGRPLVLVDRGRPRFVYRIIHGEDYSRVTLPADRPLTIQTAKAGICLVEFLPPSAKRRPFRLIAELAHTNSDTRVPMPVGIYVGRTDRPADVGGKDHLLLTAEYIDPALYRLAKIDPDTLTNGGHYAQLTGWFVGTTKRQYHHQRDRNFAAVGLPHKVAPANEVVPYQELRLEMRPGRVHLINESPPWQANVVRTARAESDMFRMLKRVEKVPPPGPYFPQSGGIGIFIHQGNARLQRLVFEPLE